MKKHFNNKGSTLVLLVMAIAVISLLGTSILGVTMMNLKIKKTNTEIKQSFYLSEAGLDKAYSNAYKLVQKAVQDANSVAQEFIEEFTSEKMADLIEKGDMKYLKSNTEFGVVVYSFNEAAIDSDAKYKFENYYKDYIEKNIVNELASSSFENSDGKLGVILTNNTPFFNHDILTIGIESNYTSSEKIKKATAVDLKINVPKYNEPYIVSTEIIPVNPFWTKVMIAENLIIESDNSTTFQGDVFLNNNLNLKGTGKAIVNGKLDVKKDIKINNAVELSTRNVCAENILLEEKSAKFSANCVVDENNKYSGVLVLDDLEMNGSNQEVNINGSYYGFGYGGSVSTDNKLNSSIIINSDDIDVDGGSSLDISGDLYLLGTSYIKGFAYATGESLSVKGNYAAYSMPLVSGYSDGKSIKGDDVVFKEYNPLPPLVTQFGDGNKLQPWNKSDYIDYYDEQYKDVDSFKLNLGKYSGGYNINLASDNIISLGISIDEGKIITSSYKIEVWETLKNEIEEAYNLGINTLGDKTVVKDVLTFNEEVKLDELSDSIDQKEYKNGILKKIVYIDKKNDDEPYTMPVGSYKGLIVTDRDIIIPGNVKFSGAIVCGGDITIIEGSDINTFNYDKGVVSNIISDNDFHISLFEPNTSKHTIGMMSFITDTTADNDAVNVDFSKLLEFNNWQIK